MPRLKYAFSVLLMAVVFFSACSPTPDTAAIRAAYDEGFAAGLAAAISPTPAAAPTPEPTPEPTPVPFEPILFTGEGDDVVQEKLPFGLYVANIQYTGDRNFSVWAHIDGSDDLMVNTIGSYDGSHILFGGKTVFEVSANSSWSIQIDAAPLLKTLDASGHGDACPGYYRANAADSGVYQITHSGQHNFSVWMYTTTDRQLLVNEIGRYDGKKLIELDDGEIAIFQVSADGDWSITKVE